MPANRRKKYVSENEVYKKNLKAELNSMGLQNCFQNFFDHGYEYVDHLPFLTDNDLKGIGLSAGDIKKFRAHNPRILNPAVKTLNVTLLGYLEAGKSCMAIRYCQQKFLEDYDPTIEATWRCDKTIGNMNLCLNILDTSGGEDNIQEQEQWVMDAECIMFVFDVTNPISLKKCQMKYERAKELRKDERHFPCVLVGNKSDLPRGIKISDALQQANKMKCAYVETSAKQDVNVDDAFEKLILSWRATLPVVEKKSPFCTIL